MPALVVLVFILQWKSTCGPKNIIISSPSLYPCPYPYPSPSRGHDHDHGPALVRDPGHYGDGGCASGLDVAEANAYQFAKRMKEGSLPTRTQIGEQSRHIRNTKGLPVCLGANPQTCARA